MLAGLGFQCRWAAWVWFGWPRWPPTARAGASGCSLGSEEPDNPGLAGPAVVDHELAAGSQLGVDELVRRDRAVDEISLRHFRALLGPPEMVLGRRYQRDRYAPTRSRRPGELPGRVGGHGVSPLP